MQNRPLHDKRACLPRAAELPSCFAISLRAFSLEWILEKLWLRSRQCATIKSKFYVDFKNFFFKDPKNVTHLSIFRCFAPCQVDLWAEALPFSAVLPPENTQTSPVAIFFTLMRKAFATRKSNLNGGHKVHRGLSSIAATATSNNMLYLQASKTENLSVTMNPNINKEKFWIDFLTTNLFPYWNKMNVNIHQISRSSLRSHFFCTAL